MVTRTSRKARNHRTRVGRIELALVKRERKRHLHAREIEAARDRCPPEPEPSRVDLILQLAAAVPDQVRIHPATATAASTIKNPSRPPGLEDLRLIHLGHDMLQYLQPGRERKFHQTCRRDRS